MTSWVDLVARVRGLSTRLLPQATLEIIARSRDARALAEALAADLSLPRPAELPHDAAALELAARRRAAARLRILGRWAAARAPLLAPIFDVEDRRSVRAMLRGATVAASVESRLAGLVPTPALPERALEELARAGDVGSVAARLSTWGHPFGAPLLAATAGPRPDLLRAERALVRAFAARAARAARKAGGAMRTWVERLVDAENAWAALLAAGQAGEPGGGANGTAREAELLADFCEGGRLVRQADFLAAVRAPGPDEARRLLRARVAGSPVVAALAGDDRTADDALLRALLAEQLVLAREDPLGLAPVIVFALRQRLEVRAVQRIAWAIELGAPGERIVQALRGAA